MASSGSRSRRARTTAVASRSRSSPSRATARTRSSSGRRDAPRPARADHRVPGSHPHVDGDRGRHARSRGGGGGHRPGGPEDRRLPIDRPRRPERQHDRLGRADHAHAHRHRRRDAGRALPAQEPRQGACACCARASTSTSAGGSRPRSRPARRAQIGGGERAEKIRTYNFPENRLTDHRIKLTQHRLDAILQGDLDDFTDALPPTRSAASTRRGLTCGRSGSAQSCCRHWAGSDARTRRRCMAPGRRPLSVRRALRADRGRCRRSSGRSGSAPKTASPRARERARAGRGVSRRLVGRGLRSAQPGVSGMSEFDFYLSDLRAKAMLVGRER